MRYKKVLFVWTFVAVIAGLGLSPVTLFASLSPYDYSPLNNSSAALVGTEQEAEGNRTTIRAYLISENGANANNVSVHFQLRDSQRRVVEESVTRLDLLHEKPRAFSLTTKPSLARGSYQTSIVVYNNQDNLVNTVHEDFATIEVKSQGDKKEDPGSESAPNPVVDPVTDPVIDPPEFPEPEPEPAPIETVLTSDDNPWSEKKFYVDSNSPAKRQADQWRSSRPADAAQMDKIAGVATAKWMGDWNQNIESDVRQAVDAAVREGAFPAFVIYNIPKRDCGGYSAGGSNNPEGYRAWIQSFARGLGGRPSAVVLEPDALSLIECLSDQDKKTRFELIKYATETLTQAGAAVYLDAGHSNWVPADQMASRLAQAGVSSARGFALNTSNFNTTEDNIRHGTEISRRIGNKPFVIDTGRNGLGSNGEWCNPSGRALGLPSTAKTGNALVDAFYWFKPPGESDGSCNGGPNAGHWWADYALGLAQRANW